MHYDTSLYSAGCKEKIDVDQAVFWSTVSKMNYKNQYSLVENIHSFLTFLIPFVIIKAKFWQWISSEFSNSS